ncbi:MAG TPA: hypothetical protein VGJ95_04990 [Pseudonocardiaceae bacterium]|jgi:hypothetical protein
MIRRRPERHKVATGCPQHALHTPQPAGYSEWFDWAERMSRTHDQVRCPGCGRFSIWEPIVGVDGVP